MLNKKTISPVITTALLLVVAVVAVVGFQGWFQTFSSDLFTKTEQQSDSDLSTTIDQVIGSNLYFKNSNLNNITINFVKVNGVDCNVNQNATNGINELDISTCVVNLTSISEAVVYTDNGIYSKKFYVKDVLLSNTTIVLTLNCSALGLVGGEWVSVPGNNDLGTSDFCVMKFEAKFVNYSGKTDTSYNTFRWDTATGDKNITSLASGGPIVYINQNDAEVACQNLGSNYHLIADPQWVTIARNVEVQSSNWNSSIIYSGYIMRGHSDGSPNRALNVINVNDPYDQTDQSAPSIERRTLYLSNNEIIWDIGGNVWEWTSGTLSSSGVLNSSLGIGIGEAYVEWNTISVSYNYLKPVNTSLTSINGIGQVYYDGNTASDGGSIHGFLRSGDFDNGVRAGTFFLDLYDAPSSSYNSVGFRCAYNP